MIRIVLIGNAGGGKSTLARRLATTLRLAHVEVDRLLWREGWVPANVEDYEHAHGEAIRGKGWVIDGLGRQESIPERLARATRIILVDMPLWVHFWLAAERQFAWAAGTLAHAPAGLTRPPPTEALFRTIWEVDRDWMPGLRALCERAEAGGTPVHRIESLDALTTFEIPG